MTYLRSLILPTALCFCAPIALAQDRQIAQKLAQGVIEWLVPKTKRGDPHYPSLVGTSIEGSSIVVHIAVPEGRPILPRGVIQFRCVRLTDRGHLCSVAGRPDMAVSIPD